MDNKELIQKLRKMDEKDGFYILSSDKEQIQPLISNGGCRTYKKDPDSKWIYVWRNRKKGAKQRVKEFISCLVMKENKVV